MPTNNHPDVWNSTRSHQQLTVREIRGMTSGHVGSNTSVEGLMVAAYVVVEMLT